MVEPTLLSIFDKGVLTLTLNRPLKLNAIDIVLADALLEELQAAANKPEVRVIRLRGDGCTCLCRCNVPHVWVCVLVARIGRTSWRRSPLVRNLAARARTPRPFAA
jgi:hypothetical protein